MNQQNETTLYVHFVDDFKNNIVSFSLNDDMILKEIFFSQSYIPQIRMEKPIFIEVKNNIAEIYSNSKLVDKTYIEDINLNSEITLKVMIDNQTKEMSFKLYKKMNYFLISFNEGDIYIKHSSFFHD